MFEGSEAMVAGSALTNEFWKPLLDEIHRSQVLPVIGPEMVDLCYPLER
jgi:hypothetical protein